MATNRLRGVQTAMFICDQCGNRQRLVTSQRHWCELCTHGSPVEMRLTRGKLHRPSTAASHLPSLIKTPAT